MGSEHCLYAFAGLLLFCLVCLFLVRTSAITRETTKAFKELLDAIHRSEGSVRNALVKALVAVVLSAWQTGFMRFCMLAMVPVCIAICQPDYLSQLVEILDALVEVFEAIDRPVDDAENQARQ